MNAVLPTERPLHRVCDRIDAVVAAGCRWVLYLTTTVLFGLLTINVVMRYTMHSSLKSAGELPELLFPWMVMAGVVLAMQHGAHIAIAWFVEKLPRPLRRAVALLNGAILVVAYSVLAWGTWTLLPVVHDEISNVLRVPGSVTYACMLLGFSLMVLTTLTQTARLLAGDEVRDAQAAGFGGDPADQVPATH